MNLARWICCQLLQQSESCLQLQTVMLPFWSPSPAEASRVHILFSPLLWLIDTHQFHRIHKRNYISTRLALQPYPMQAPTILVHLIASPSEGPSFEKSPEIALKWSKSYNDDAAASFHSHLKCWPSSLLNRTNHCNLEQVPIHSNLLFLRACRFRFC